MNDKSLARTIAPAVLPKRLWRLLCSVRLALVLILLIAAASLAGALGYGIGLFLDAGLPSVARFVRRDSRSMTVKQPRVKKVNKETK